MFARRAVGPLCLLIAILLAPAATAGKVKVKTYETDLSTTFAAAKGSKIELENLLGSIEVLPQPKGRDVRIRAHVTCEAVEATEAKRLAEQVQLARKDEDGTVKWSVTFPDARLFRMPKTGVGSMYSRWLAPLVKRKTISTRYEGRAVEVGNARGATALQVTVKIEVPMDLSLSVIQHVGTVEASGVRGNVALQVKQGELHAGRLFGDLRVITEGASARVWSFNGDTLSVETGSGPIELLEIRSDRVRIDSARGAVNGNKIDSTHLEASTGSGKLLLEGLEPESMTISSDAGDVELATELKRTKEGTIRSATGNVTVRLGTFASFTLEANSPDGAVKGSGVNVEVDQFEKNAASLVRGNGGASLSVESQSGQILIRPL
ncbi:MAG: DUF4097 family beta strand repeat protein [Acidobacteria bacterium]|nr:DUF4097 family beta strand repeat protein [Acidobacteriota bacterium]NIM64202.1 DUF4097 family beta strand repeat protein [Acidobacteriota bacterium]NIO59654.1 DUF4097 family beta strand repeat protein [Acidobacteriota bacterium]NIQ30748.1 DUF4097 family beta strand repeat protein [Acidobacteriota bacterium]NIQ85775.1 DUF4097 family beta strand repeat protein [Acidobacteriota bacterium]